MNFNGSQNFQNMIRNICGKNDNLNYSIEFWKKAYDKNQIDYMEMQNNINGEFYNEYLEHFKQTRIKTGINPKRDSRLGLLNIALLYWLAIYDEKTGNATYIPFVFNNDQTKIKTLLNNKMYTIDNEQSLREKMNEMQTRKTNQILNELIKVNNIRAKSKENEYTKQHLQELATKQVREEVLKDLRNRLYDILKQDYTRSGQPDYMKIFDTFTLMNTSPVYKNCADSRGLLGVFLNKYLIKIDDKYIINLDDIQSITQGISELETVSLRYKLEEMHIHNSITKMQETSTRDITDF